MNILYTEDIVKRIRERKRVVFHEEGDYFTTWTLDEQGAKIILSFICEKVNDDLIRFIRKRKRIGNKKVYAYSVSEIMEKLKLYQF